MDAQLIEQLPRFLDRLMLTEEPVGVFYTDKKPENGLSPNPMPTPTREAEMKNQINWGKIFGGFSCVMGHVWRARRKKMAAYFSKDRFGCPGGAYWLGFVKPQSETIIHYVSTGIPGHMEGEQYCDSADTPPANFHGHRPPARAGGILRHQAVEPV